MARFKITNLQIQPGVMTACTSVHFCRVERADGFIYTHICIRTREITHFRACKQSKSDILTVSPHKEGEHSQRCTLGSKSTMKNFAIQLFMSSGSRHEDMYTAKALLSRQLLLKNFTDYLSQQICCF